MGKTIADGKCCPNRLGFDKKPLSTIRLWTQILSDLNKRLYIRSYENQFSTT